MSNDYKSDRSGEGNVLGELIWIEYGECYYFNCSIGYLS